MTNTQDINIEFEFEWVDDWEIISHVDEYDCYDEEPTTCEGCICRLGGEVLASLWCIDDATDEYRRLIESELADEALYELVNRSLAPAIAAHIES